ncbi:MAG: hypothetical protein RJB66_93 [Pseudomonadota bacterium]|jgi:hypothetical protein
MFQRVHKFCVVILTAIFVLGGCSSWMTRQSCADIDWFHYGESVALQGKRLTGDEQVKRCKEADFAVPYSQLDAGFKTGMNKYCLPKTVFATGKAGDLFNPEMCDPGQARSLQQEYLRGIEGYCSVENGYTAGSSGKKYHNVCPQKTEAAFLKEYRRGRKAFLTGKINEADLNMIGVERQTLELERQRNNVSWRLSAIPAPYRNQKPEDDPYRSERDRLASELRGVEAQINQKQNEKDRWLKSKGEFQAELATLAE